MSSLCKEATPLVSRLLRRCSAVTSMKVARKLHALLLTSPTAEPYTPFLHNNILSMYSKCGALRDARQLFDRMPHRNLISFNAMISSYSQEMGSAINCFELFSQLRIDGDCSEPNAWTFMSLMQATSLLRNWWVGSMLHCLVVKFGCYCNFCVQTAMLMMYSNCGDLGCSRKVFHDMDCRDSFAWDAMIIGNMKNDRIEDGLDVYASMRKSSVVPTQFTYTKVFNGCARLGDFCRGRLIHAHVIISGIGLDLQLQNTMLDMYCSCGNTQMAYKVFNRIDVPDLVSWNTMISGYSENEDGEKTLDFYVQFLRLSCIGPDEYTFAAVVSGISDMPCLQCGRPLHAQLYKWGFEQSMYAGSTLILMYLKNGETDSARRLFNLMSNKDVILWTEMITGHSQIGDGKNAVKFYHQMFQEGYRIDSFSLSGALSACADLATLKQGEMIHVHAIKTGNCSDMSVAGCLVDMYAKNGQLESAESLFFQLTNPEMKYWNSMLGGYSSHGKAQETLNLYNELLRRGDGDSRSRADSEAGPE
uniref:Pentatricopeptide repeat-containing protein n=1 Tax=Kalanchoe fedtschenkoi TaxID=63787 RepID=A0A7N0T9M1_KALFE